MIIDVPVLIYIDAEDNGRQNTAASKRTFTMRLDVDKDDEPITYCNHYPPREGATFFKDGGDVFAMALGTDEYKRLVSRARANPYDYLCADVSEEERQAAQDKVDAEKDPTP